MSRKLHIACYSLILYLCACHTAKHPAAMNELMLNGKITRADLQTHFIWYKQRYKEYSVNDTAAAQLKPYATHLKVLLVMGTWCGDSKAHVPAFFKIADAIGLRDGQVEMIAVDRNKQCASVDISALHIEYVPTFFFFIDGKPIGRIVEEPQQSIEEDLAHLVENMNK